MDKIIRYREKAALYQSLVRNQSELKKDSNIICIDTAKVSNHHGCNPYECFVIILTLQLWITAKIYSINHQKGYSYALHNWQRDDPSIFVKEANEFDEVETAKLIEIMADIFDEHQANVLLKWMDTFCKSYNSDKMKTAYRESGLIELCILNKVSDPRALRKAKIDLFKLWFRDDLIKGPILVTRGLALDTKYHFTRSYTVDPQTAQVIEQFDNPEFYGGTAAYTLMFDDNMYSIPGYVNEYIQHPLDIHCDYVGICEDAQWIRDKSDSVIEETIIEYVFFSVAKQYFFVAKQYFFAIYIK